jgi:Uma2 family endonuclease
MYNRANSLLAYPHYEQMSVKEYKTLASQSQQGRYEYVDGYAYLLAGGTRYHAVICGNVNHEFRLRLHGTSCQVYTSDAALQLSETRYFYPDVSVSCDPRDTESEGTMVHYPRLVVEVLSYSTEAYDRGEKFDYYRTCPTLQEYVLISVQHPSIHVYRRASELLWTFHAFGLHDDIELTSLGITIPFTSIYQNITFERPPYRSL